MELLVLLLYVVMVAVGIWGLVCGGRRPTRECFTIIELLVVMAIMVILAAIIWPVFAAVRRRSQQVVCASNLRQLGLAIQIYSQDHDGYPPIGAYNYVPLPPAPQEKVRVDWEDELTSAAYVKSRKLFKCPSNSNTDYRAAYGANHYVLGWEWSPLLDGPPFPSNTVLLTEKTGADWVAWPPTESVNNPYYYPLDPRHENQLNIAFVDGHVGHVIVNELIEGSGSGIIWRW